MIKCNYHTHTPRCHHAVGSEEEYVKKAIESKMRVLGFSDHACWPHITNSTGMRMKPQELDNYCACVAHVKEKYQDEIEIYCGLEAEYFVEHMDFLENLLERKVLDYVIFGNHFNKVEENGKYFGMYTKTVQDVLDYVDLSVKGMQWGRFTYFAHPDLFLRSYEDFDENARQASIDICKASIQYDVPLEYNLGGIRCDRMDGVIRFPRPQFWEIAASMKAQVIIGIDAHEPANLVDEKTLSIAKKRLDELGIVPIESVTFK